MPDGILRPGGFELTEQLVRLAKLKPGARILDVGCGFGGSVAYLSSLGYRVTGIDISEALLEHGRELYPDHRLFVSNAEYMPFEDETFDALLFECSLSLMDMDAVLTEALCILRPSGKLLISDVFYHSAEEFGKLLRLYGFEVTRIKDKTNVFEEFVAQLIMSTGSVDVLFDCEQWEEIKMAKPRYCLAIARKKELLIREDNTD